MMNYKVLKEAVQACRKVLSRYLRGGTEENYEPLTEIGRYPCQDLNPGPPEYEAGVPTTSSAFTRIPTHRTNKTGKNAYRILIRKLIVRCLCVKSGKRLRWVVRRGNCLYVMSFM
jgi:hypothetical protein